MEHQGSKGAVVAAPPVLNHDGSEMLDERGRVIYRSQFLSTHPLKCECKGKVIGGILLTYITGDAVIRTMNTAFGNDGWSTSITSHQQVMCKHDYASGKWTVGYMATIKVSTRENSHEDVGFGEACDKRQLKAVETAVKSAVTDAMKRAARHFGERLGNALYVTENGMQIVPQTNKEALQQLEVQEANDLFGNQSSLYARKRERRHAEIPAQQMDQAAEVALPREQELVGLSTALQSQNQAPSTLSLERNVTPPFRMDNHTSLQQQPHECSPAGFASASVPVGAVTPLAQRGAHCPSPRYTWPPSVQGMQETPMTDPLRLASAQPPPCDVEASQRQHPVGQQTRAPDSGSLAAKRQKVSHNPYQR